MANSKLNKIQTYVWCYLQVESYWKCFKNCKDPSKFPQPWKKNTHSSSHYHSVWRMKTNAFWFLHNPNHSLWIVFIFCPFTGKWNCILIFQKDCQCGEESDFFHWQFFFPILMISFIKLWQHDWSWNLKGKFM